MVKSYCVKQKKQTECVPGSERYVKAKNGRTMMKCTCAECGITKTKFIRSRKGGENPLGKAFEAAKFVEQITRKIIPSTNPVFDRYWSGDIAKGAFNTKTGLFSKEFWSPGSVAKEEDPFCDQITYNPKTKKYVNHKPCKNRGF